MPKSKRTGKKKLTSAEKRQKKLRRSQFKTVLINGKQKRIKKPDTIDGMDVDEFIRRTADPIWLLENGFHHYLDDHSGQDHHPHAHHSPLFCDDEPPF